jgi:hypothetical protein
VTSFVLATINAPSRSGPITPELGRELALARRRSKAIRNAASVATFNGWATGIIAALSAPFALFSVAGFILTVGLVIVANNEFRGRKGLREFDPASATLLGWNQVGLWALIAVYCLWTLFTSIDSFAADLQAKPEWEAALGSLDEFDGLYRTIIVGFYATVIVLSAVFQGLNSLYYFTRRKYVNAYLQETPAWVQEIERMISAT